MLIWRVEEILRLIFVFGGMTCRTKVTVGDTVGLAPMLKSVRALVWGISVNKMTVSCVN